jgi:L-fuculose-phosphate aldolase
MKFQAKRELVVKTCIDLADRGFLAATGGNVALRADHNHFAVTPSATDYYAMSAADVCVIRLSDREQVEGEREASVESGVHAGILSARPDCGASIHTHQPVASAYTLLAKPLEVRDRARQALLGRSIPCVGYAPSGTALLARRVARSLRHDTHAYLMGNHGAVCVGKDETEAMIRVAALESECASYFLTGAAARQGKLDESVRTLVIQSLLPVLEGALIRFEDVIKPKSKTGS